MTGRILLLLSGASLALAACDAPPPDRAAPGPEQATTAPAPTCWEKLPPATASTQTSATGGADTPGPTQFQTPCPADLPPDFIASLQRALSARALYHGPITGKMNPSTGTAVRHYQMPDGIDSSILSLAAARRLGLIAIELPEA